MLGLWFFLLLSVPPAKVWAQSDAASRPVASAELLEDLVQIALSGTVSLEQTRKFDERMGSLARPERAVELEAAASDAASPALKRRLAEIALDRLRQPQTYEAIEEYKLTYHQWFLQKKTNWREGVGRRGDTMPRPLDPEHLSSSWRLPWEEMLFRGRWWQGKEQAAMALARIGDPQSLVPIRVQLLSTLAVWDGVSGKGHIERAVRQMVKTCLCWPGEQAFEALSDAYLLESAEGKQALVKELLGDARWVDFLIRVPNASNQPTALAGAIEEQLKGKKGSASPHGEPSFGE
ncbi:MAG: hypothetical protein HYU36_02825 [Planctomycetes bacterium]|nr:hypothetical protein [Planctomycetota bacterium]